MPDQTFAADTRDLRCSTSWRVLVPAGEGRPAMGTAVLDDDRRLGSVHRDVYPCDVAALAEERVATTLAISSGSSGRSSEHPPARTSRVSNRP